MTLASVGLLEALIVGLNVWLLLKLGFVFGGWVVCLRKLLSCDYYIGLGLIVFVEEMLGCRLNFRFDE